MRSVIRLTTLSILVLLLAAVANAKINGYTAPLSGKFFYAQMYETEEKGLHIPVTIGSGEGKNITQDWYISSSEHMMASFDEICMLSGRGCVNTADPDSKDLLINDTISNGHRIPGALIYESAEFTDADTLYDNFLMNGIRMFNQFNFTLEDYKRETIFDNSTSFIIYQVTQPAGVTVDLKNGVTGYLGIQPYTVNLQQKFYSFLYQLKYTVGYVDHLCISFYKTPNADGLSLLKFGSYDKNGLKDSDINNLKIFKTTGLEGWILETKNAKIGNEEIFVGGDTGGENMRTMEINPQFQYTYIPQKDFTKFKEIVQREFPAVDCTTNKDTCYFNQSCSAVGEMTFSMSLEVTDNTGEIDIITATWNDLKAKGDVFGMPGTCYFGIFGSQGDTLSSQWVVGSKMMSEKYYFLDMSPYINQESAYFAIGMGPINPIDKIGVVHYDYRSNDFMPELNTDDMSKQISGTNPYDTDQYQRGHERRVEFNSDDEKSWYQENYTFLIVIGVMAIIFMISLIIMIIYCKKSRQIHLEEEEDKGLINRGPSVNFTHENNTSSRLVSINAMADVQNDPEISLDSGENQKNKLDTTPNQYY